MPRQQIGSSGYALNIADNSVTGAKILDGSVSSSDVDFMGAITANKWCVANAAGTALDCTADTPAGVDSDWIISGTDMYSGVTGKVGIGTSNPQANFEISSNGTDFTSFRLTETDSTAAIWELRSHQVNPNNGFSIWGGTQGSEKTVLVIGSNGRIGINTIPLSTSPQLTVNNTIRLLDTNAPDVACSLSTEGTIYYRDSINRICYCDGISYKRIDTNAAC